ncbi:hypothetical protein CkaCkLH20_05138 [Colletotrichum karsti]|uniref:EH domain-containing protein n=1 Tax=Colletotrichum karsti TaxID=1095194 RepID=A0A9P6LL65_9PEZI|nr:uncharacterized protein CkaCkLH20_05138 [Colletotrichum karsti]KAF9877438.1 hypothetical protein CkaCkLH20_05138 [Colletotrichum karsti]
MMTNTPHQHHHQHRNGGASDAAAALKGASLAFSKTKPKPIPPPKPSSSSSALAPRTLDRSLSTSPIQRQHTGASVATTTTTTFGRDGTAEMRDRLSSFLASSPSAASHLSPHARVDPKSPSYIAAALAASRSASPSPQPQASPSALTPAQVNQLQQMRESARRRGEESEDEDGGPDTTSIPAARNLIGMFERAEEDVDPVKKSGGDGRRPAVRTMTPEREMSPARARASRMEERPAGKGPVLKTKPRMKTRPVTPTPVAEKGEEGGRELVKKPVLKPKKLRPVTPTPGDGGPPRSTKPAVSPAKKPTHKRTESELSVQTMRPPAKSLQPAAEVRKKQSPPRLAPSAQPKEPPAAPEPRRSRPQAKQAPPSSPPIRRAQTEVVSPEPRRPASKARVQPPTPPQPRGTAAKSRDPDGPKLVKPKSMASVYSQAPLQEPFLPRTEIARPSTADTSSSNDTFVSASSGLTAVPDHTPARPPTRQTPSALSTPGRSSVNSSPTRTTPRRTPASSTASLPLNSLSNAIMAGSLAAARLTPSNTGNSTLSPPPALPSRTKSPRLRQTLRQPPSKSDDDEDDKMRRKRHQRASNKHSHAEGARRRWRDEISLRERRRYEAVWASNRGALVSLLHHQVDVPPDAADCVVNVVAREIWRRSRLPPEELAEVWDLVDRGGRGMLGKQEFVVGMWLVDQRLRGRKIPRRVGASVWDSAQGVKVLEPRKK